MAPPLSDDLKRRIYHWYTTEDNIIMKDCAQRAGCSIGSVAKVMKNIRDFGTVSNPLSKHTGRPRVADDGDDLYIREIIKSRPTIYLDELQIKLETVRNVFLSIPTISRTLRRLELSNKRVQRAASERNEDLRAIWEGELGQHEYQDPDLFVFLDESAVDNHTFQRTMGWSQINTPCVERGTFLRGTRYSILPALSIEGIIALDIFEGSVTKEIFLNYIREQVVSNLLGLQFISYPVC